MTDISLPRYVRSLGRGATAVRSINARRYLSDAVHAQNSISQVDPRKDALLYVKREFASGFVDFLLGRGIRQG
jgi:hypothetical protein